MEDDFDDLDLVRTDTNLSMSKVYEVKKCGFGFTDSEGLISYITSHRIEDLIDDLVTFEKLTSDKQWPVSQIIQREIDLQRVKNIANQYITKQDFIKYFPPITVVILPIDDASKHIAKKFSICDDEIIDESYRRIITQKWLPIVGGDYDQRYNKYIKDSVNESNSIGLYQLNVNKSFCYTLLAWDNSKYSAVVIDGQHRLEALRIAAQQDNKYKNFMQDVVFIDISKRVEATSQTPVELVRKIFIDINSNAEEVSSARKYVMDDKDLASLFVQTLANDDDANNSRQGKFILPQLIDWHAENLKHELPHITGVMVLYQLMSDYVLNTSNLISIDDMRHARKVQKWVDYLNSNFKVDHQITTLTKYNGVKKLKTSLNEFNEEILSSNNDECDGNLESYLFQYDYHVLRIAQDYFEKNYSKAIVKFFNELTPYRVVIDLLSSKDVFNQENKLYKLVVTHPKKVTGENKDLINDLKTYLKNATDERFYLPLTVLGQKALFSIFFSHIMQEMQAGVSEEKAVNSASDIINKFNILFEIFSFSDIKLFEKERKPFIKQDILDKYRISMYGKQASYFWEDIVYKDTSIIYNSQGISSLRQTFEYFFRAIDILTDGKKLGELKFEPNYVKPRIKRRIENEHQKTTVEAETASNDILKAKKEFIDDFILDAFNKYTKNKSLTPFDEKIT